MRKAYIVLMIALIFAIIFATEIKAALIGFFSFTMSIFVPPPYTYESFKEVCIVTGGNIIVPERCFIPYANCEKDATICVCPAYDYGLVRWTYGITAINYNFFKYMPFEGCY